MIIIGGIFLFIFFVSILGYVLGWLIVNLGIGIVLTTILTVIIGLCFIPWGKV